MIRRILTFLILSTSTLSAQSYLSQIIPNFDKLKTPHIKTVSVERTDSSIRFKFHSSIFSITQYGDLVQPLITVQKGGKTMGRYLLAASPFFPDAECTIVSFDADHNGIDDLFLSFPYGLSGQNSNINIIASFFFFPNSTFKYVQLQSYYGDVNLFRDYNHDGRFEYACVNQLLTDSGEYDALNLFSIKNGDFKNITKNAQGFPIFIKRTDSGPVVVPQLPPSISGSWYLEKPEVLTEKNQLMN